MSPSYSHEHAVCITGLQRSYPEISHNIHFALSSLYSGWRGVRNDRPPVDQASFSLENSVGFFGVRPANDTWATVRTDLPPLLAESIQTPCYESLGMGARAPWFSAYAKTIHQRVVFSFSFVQMMCDLRACYQLVQAHERNERSGREFDTLARLRLDLAWETPLVMPPGGLLPNTIYTSRMNTKAGLNDKWGIGHRYAMGRYLSRAELIPIANALHNRSAKPLGLKATGRTPGLLSYACAANKINEPFTCAPHFNAPMAQWQFETQPRLPQRRFSMTSEGFLMWALWRSNLSIGFEPSWMFCKFGNAVNMTARICVPRMRARRSCTSLVCPGGLTDCGCRNQTCEETDKRGKKSKMWYCESVKGIQLALDPYAVGRGGTY